jgi:hypothetical protein
MSNSGFDNIESLRLRGEDVRAIHTRKAETPSSKRRDEKRRQEFIKTPLCWVDQLAKTHHRATVFVALRLLRLAWQHRDKPVTLSNLGLAEWGVTRSEKQRALAELEAVGLIAVERSKRKAPRVTLLQM